jgi:hypothetical protein
MYFPIILVNFCFKNTNFYKNQYKYIAFCNCIIFIYYIYYILYIFSTLTIKKSILLIIRQFEKFIVN